MNKQEVLSNYKKEEDKLLVAKTLDKIDFCNIKNKIMYTDFLDLAQKNIIQRLLNRFKIQNYVFFGGFDSAERTICVFYPNKLNIEMVKKNYDNIIKVIEIELPNDLNGKYNHRDYLGGLMKLGIKREKIGDILVNNNGAQIIALKELSEFLENNLKDLTRFSKSEIQIKNLEQLQEVEIKKEEIKIIVPSLRLDNLVSEISKTSRTKAEEIIRQERVLVNFETVTKDSKLIKEKDILTIRGKGRFKLLEIVGNTKKGRYILTIEKYV